MSSAALAATQAVRFERLLPGPVERVWDYLTRPDLQRTWLADSAADVNGVTDCQPLRRLEYSMRDSSVVSFELQPRGRNVLLVLTHRRVPARVREILVGAGTVLAVALLMFSFCRSDNAI